MTIIDADKFLAYLIFSKHIDRLTCGEVKEAIEMCKVDVLDKIKAEIEQLRLHKAQFLTNDNKVCIDSQDVLNIIDKYKAESEDKI